MQGHVTILNCSPDMAAIIASGGRISTMDGTADEIYAKSLSAGQEKNEKLIGKVLSSGHTSVLEHGYVNLAFENVSVYAEQFMIEFRLASFTVKSRRYVDFSKAGYVSPELESDAQKTIFDETVRGLFAIYDEREAAGVPKEDARFVLPYCFCSNFFCSMNARELLHVMNELRYGRGSEKDAAAAGWRAGSAGGAGHAAGRNERARKAHLPRGVSRKRHAGAGADARRAGADIKNVAAK